MLDFLEADKWRGSSFEKRAHAASTRSQVPLGAVALFIRCYYTDTLLRLGIMTD